MQNNFRFIYSAVVLMISFCAVTFLGNIFYTIQNQKLSTAVSDNFDEKASLRARFLSRISASNLTSKADNYQMIQLSQNQIYRVKNENNLKPKKDFWSNLSFTLTQENIASGY